MPEQIQPKQLDFKDPERFPYSFFGVSITDAQAVSIVKQTYDRYSSWRHRNHDTRWQANDNLYLGLVPKRTWPGSQVPRSNLGIQISFDQIQTAYPLIIGEIFGQKPYWFDVSASPFSTPQEAQQVKENLAYHLDSPLDVGGKNATQQLKLAILEILQHGNGVIEVGWNTNSQGLLVDYVPLRDLYFDPGLSTPSIDDSAVVIRRKLVTVQDIQRLKDTRGFNVPPDEVLNWLSKNTASSPGDRSLKNFAAGRGENVDLGTLNQSPADPIHHKLELLQYWTNDRMIWLLGKVWPLVNRPNPLRFKPFAVAPLFTFLGRAYGMSVPDMLEGEQKLIQGVTNARIDELALGIIPTQIRGGADPNERKHTFYPGFVDRVNDVSQVTVSLPMNITQSSFQEVAVADARAQRRIGMNSFAQTGVPTPSNSNRTAQGVNKQAGFIASRLRPIIENIEDYLIVPFLYKAQRIIAQQTQQQEEVPGLGQDGQATVVPRSILGRPVRFKMEASSRMIARNQLAVFLQPLTQLLTSDSLQRMIGKQGMVVDLLEWQRYMQDTTQTSTLYKFFRQATPEELQSLQQPPPEVQATMQKAQLESQTRLQMGQLKSQTELQTTQMEVQGKGSVAAESSAAKILKILSDERLKRRELKEGKKDAAKSRTDR